MRMRSARVPTTDQNVGRRLKETGYGAAAVTRSFRVRRPILFWLLNAPA
jgi:hypothetical protein